MTLDREQSYDIDAFDLSVNAEIREKFREGQRAALEALGVADKIPHDASVQPGTYAIVARTASGGLIGGVQIHLRTEGRPLPLETESSPIAADFRGKLAEEPNLCEIGSLWVDSHAAGRFLSRKIVSYGTALGYRLGADAVIGLSHARAFRFITLPLGYARDTGIPEMNYPDERFQSFVVWHRGGIAALREGANAPEVQIK